jgi:hypothetical protein
LPYNLQKFVDAKEVMSKASIGVASQKALLHNAWTLRHDELNKWQNSLKDMNGWVTHSKNFVSERKWLKFLGAPRPFNAKEDFYSIVSQYFDSDSVILELSPKLYSHIRWRWTLLGGIFSTENELAKYNKLTRDIVSSGPIPLNYVLRIYTLESTIPQVVRLLNKYGLNVEVLRLEMYASYFDRGFSWLVEHKTPTNK